MSIIPIWSPQADRILSVGQSLESVGVRNWALNLNQTLIALDQLKAEGIVILGGDVYQKQNEVLQSNYDSWHCDRHPGESKDAFADRSYWQAKNYVLKYTPLLASECFFVIVTESRKEQ